MSNYDVKDAATYAVLKMRHWQKANVKYKVNYSALESYLELCDWIKSMENLSETINEEYHE